VSHLHFYHESVMIAKSRAYIFNKSSYDNPGKFTYLGKILEKKADSENNNILAKLRKIFRNLDLGKS